MFNVPLRSRCRLSCFWPGMLLFATGLAMRIYYANTLYLHFDETIQLNAASARQWLAYHHPPLLLWWVWLAAQWSEQVWWLRFAPCLAGSITPVCLALWLRQKNEETVAWSVGCLLALSPNVVLLSIQLRGYAFAMLATVIAFWTAEAAFLRHSNRAMVAHWVAVGIGLLSELSFLFVLIATSAYGLLYVRDASCPRALRRCWGIGVAVSCGICVWLLVALVLPMMDLPRHVTAYLEPLLYNHHQSILRFVCSATYAQFAYLFGIVPGLFALGFFVVGCGSMWLSGERRVLLAVAPFVALGFSYLQLYPMGATRHTVVIGLATLVAIVAGIERLGRRNRWVRFSIALLLVCSAIKWPKRDTMNFPLDRWKRHDWETAIEYLSKEVPSESIIVVDGYLSEMLLAQFNPPAGRSAVKFWRNKVEALAIGPWQAIRFDEYPHAVDMSHQIRKLVSEDGVVRRRNKERVWVVAGFWRPLPAGDASVVFRNSVMTIATFAGWLPGDAGR